MKISAITSLVMLGIFVPNITSGNADLASVHSKRVMYVADPHTVSQFLVIPPKESKVWARVTACSPSDPKDVAYYSKYGYEGRKAKAVAADPKVFPKGTYLKIPGYNQAPVPVDSKGGGVIRKSTSKGIVHIDVKFRTHREAVNWGNKWMFIYLLE
jgi:3D (Asp-Asp-Asp) domain-containing protein